MELTSERNIKGKYQDLGQKKLTGAHYTPVNLAQFVAFRIIENFDFKNKTTCSIFDPALGDGELLFALASLLLDRGIKHVSISGFDIDPKAINIAKGRLNQLGKNVSLELYQKDFTIEASDAYQKKFDLVIANPPYVRTQSLGAATSSKLSDDYLLEGRIDLYYIFLMGISKFMHEDSVAGYIVSNRFMTTKSGASVRTNLLQDYSLNEIWDLGDTKLFDAAVLPAVIVFSKKSEVSNRNSGFTSIYSSKNSDQAKKVSSVFEALIDESGAYTTHDGRIFEVKKGILPTTDDTSDVWRVSNTQSDSWLEQVACKTAQTFGDIGKIRVGVKTTADKVFIRKTWDDLEASSLPEDEILKPLITHHFARRFKELEGNARKILYPYDMACAKKQAVDIKKFPKALTYLTSHKPQLEGRDYLIEAGRHWYEIWVPQEPSLWKNPKIVFRDISDKPTFWMDKSGAIVNGDCYWITPEKNVNEDLLWIALAVANSTFIESFYDHKFNNKLYAGRRRFMTQYVEQFPIPALSTQEEKKIISLTKKIYEQLPTDVYPLESELDKLIWNAFGF